VEVAHAAALIAAPHSGGLLTTPATLPARKAPADEETYGAGGSAPPPESHEPAAPPADSDLPAVISAPIDDVDGVVE
jgi:hypothetical protein